MPSVDTARASARPSARNSADEGWQGPASPSPPQSPQSPKAPGHAGVQHRRKDFYSESSPIPSIQRFFKRGLYDVILSREDDEDTDYEDDELDDAEPRKKQATGAGDDDLPASTSQQGQPSPPKKGSKSKSGGRRANRTRNVDDPITHQPVVVRDVGRREYDSAMQQADTRGGADNNNERVPSSPPTSPLRRQFSHFHRRSDSTPSKDDTGAGTGSQSQAQPAEDESSTVGIDGQSPPRAPSVKSHDYDQRTRRRVNHTGASRNVLTMPFPPGDPLPSHISQIHPMLLPLFIAWATVSLTGFVPRFVTVAMNAWLGWWAFATLVRRTEDARWDKERQRGLAAQKGVVGNYDDDTGKVEDGIKESAEWLNALMDQLWAVMNPDLFSTMGQTLEDVMQASIPRFIHAVKVEDLAQGSTPLRLTGFRVLPDSDTQDLQKATEDNFRQRQGKEKENLGPSLRERARDSVAKEGDAGQGENGEADQIKSAGANGGSFINLEISFMYRARPTAKTVTSKSRNAHLLIKFWVGLRKIATVPLPVLVEIKGMVGTVRARVQLTPDPPFFKNVTFTFMGLPRVGVDVIPLHINTTNIPVLSGFIQSSMDAAMGEYCAPSSLTMDVGEMLMGDNIKREVHALGVVLVYIHSATDLEKQDVQGSSDPYCTLQLAKAGKVLYATRVALNDLSPRWEERHVILITPEAISAREKISIGLWDSDRFSADDMLGRAEVDLQALVKRPGRMFRRTDTLIGLTQEMSKQGNIEWSLGYFAKVPNRRRLDDSGAQQRERKEAEKVEKQDPDAVEVQEEDVGTDAPSNDEDADSTGEIFSDNHKSSANISDYDDKQNAKQTRNIEHGVSFEPPSPALPSGILSMQVHSVAQLECIDTRSSGSDSKQRGMNGAPGQDVEGVENEEDTATSPSSFFRIILNDETVFRSRTKTLSSNPFFNAGTERFIRDWRRTLVMFVVYDSRLREEDAILGVVPIKLTDLFRETSQVTTVFPLAGGVGRGQMRMSLLFRPVSGMSRRQEKLGWDIGTMRLLGPPCASDFQDASGSKSSMAGTLSSASIYARTLAGSVRIQSRRAHYTDSEARDKVEWSLRKEDFPLKIPVRRRYAAPLVFEFHSVGGAIGLRRRTVAMCILWMQDVPDDGITEFRLPIWRAREGNDLHRLQQNYHSYQNEEEAEKLGVERVGYFTAKMQFKSGLGHVHTKFDTNPDAKIVMDVWRACASVGLRDVGGDFANMRWNTQGLPIEDERDSQDLGHDEGDYSGRPESEGDSGTVSGSETDEEPTSELRNRIGKSTDDGNHNDNDDDDTLEEEEGGDEDAEADISHNGILDKVRKWSDERRELHRQHRGIKQYKTARTATWIGHGIKERGAKVINNLTIQDRGVKQVESEL